MCQFQVSGGLQTRRPQTPKSPLNLNVFPSVIQAPVDIDATRYTGAALTLFDKRIMILPSTFIQQGHKTSCESYLAHVILRLSCIGAPVAHELGAGPTTFASGSLTIKLLMSFHAIQVPAERESSWRIAETAPMLEWNQGHTKPHLARELLWVSVYASEASAAVFGCHEPSTGKGSLICFAPIFVYISSQKMAHRSPLRR